MKAENMFQLEALCESIRRRGFLTGSQVFGVATKDSDTDFVMEMADAYAMYRELGIEPFKEPSEDYAGCFISLKYHSCHGWINLIIVPSDEDLKAWIYATHEMKKMYKKFIRGKAERQKYFGWLLTEYYAFIPKGKHYKMALDTWGVGKVPRC